MATSRPLSAILESEDKSLQKLFLLIGELTQRIVREIPRALGTTEGTNIYGEKQTQIDVWSNQFLTTKLLKSGLVSQVASEELEEVEKSGKGEYSVVLDPLDGSSNIKTNNLIGTIVGVYHDKDLPARGKDLIASGYFLYGPYIELVLATSDGVYDLVAAGRDKGGDRFIGTGDPHRLPEKPSIYGIGGMKDKWVRSVKEFVERLEKRKFKLRYGGSFVGDYNQVFHNGGFFAYPSLIDAPNGKYRLQFESNPIGFVTVKAGGRASTGRGNILDVEPSSIDQRVPTYLGNRDLVAEFEELEQKPIVQAE